MFIVDTDRENIKRLSKFLALKHTRTPDIWQNRHRYLKFLVKSEIATVFIRVDNSAIPGVELTQAAIASGTNIHVVWMAASDAYAVDAFRYGVEAYLLLPATEDAFAEVMKSIVL